MLYAMYWQKGNGMNWGMYWSEGIMLLFLGVGAWFDIKDRTLPIWYILCFALAGILCNGLFRYQKISELLIGALVGIVFLFLGKITKESIGYGDGLGITVMGIFQGSSLLLSLLFAFGLSSGYGIWKLWVKKVPKDEQIPFFPFLLVGTLGAMML